MATLRRLSLFFLLLLTLVAFLPSECSSEIVPNKGRQQRVSFLGSYSKWNPFNSGVPQVIPQSHGSHGVFMVIEGDNYTFNFKTANAICSSLNVTMATRDQMEQAVQHGLETCKFGWIAEKIAVVPRQTSDKKCGAGKTGVVPWATALHWVFAVFCFNASAVADLDKPLVTTAASSQSRLASTRLTALTQNSTPPSTGSLPSTKQPTSSALRRSPPVQTTGFIWVSSSVPYSERLHNSISPQLITSKHPVITLASSPSSHSSTSPDLSKPGQPNLGNSEKHFLGAVGLALVVLVGLAAAAVVWHFKSKRRSSCSCERRQQQDDAETEMWKHTNSETDLHNEQGAEMDPDDEELDRKFSSDITLYVNPLM